MALNWYVGDIKNSDDVCWMTATKNSADHGRTRGEEYLNPITDALIWATMSIGLNEITAENVDEWESRLALAYATQWISTMTFYAGEESDGNIKWEPRRLTRADVERHIGLSTNASYESPAAWRKRVVEQITNEAIRESKRCEKDNVELDAIWQKESLELRDAIRAGRTTKEREALPKNQPAN